MPTPTKTIALIVLTGEQDFKLWVDPDDPRRPTVRIPKPCSRRVHDLFISGLPGASARPEGERPAPLWRVCSTTGELPVARLDATDPAHREKLDAIPGWSDSVGQRLDALCERCGTNRDGRAARLPPPLFDASGRILLYPAKLGGLVRSLENDPTHPIEIVRVLAFATDRPPPEDDAPPFRLAQYASEPHASGLLTAQWLADRFSLAYHDRSDFSGPGTSWVNLLEHDFNYDGPEGTSDHPVRRRVAGLIERAIARVAEHCPNAYPVVATTGGFGDMKPIIVEAVALHFEKPATLYFATEEHPDAPLDLERIGQDPENATLTESLAARAHARRRIAEGDLPAAWGAVAHLRNSRPDQSWLDALGNAVGFIDGRNQTTLQELGLPEDAEKQNLLRAAFRVEAALQGRIEDQRLPQALLATTAFIETALFNAVRQALETAGNSVQGERVVFSETGWKAFVGTIDRQRTSRGKPPLNQSPSKDAKSEYDKLLTGCSGYPPGNGGIKLEKAGFRGWRHWLIDQPAGTDAHHLGLAIETFECLLFAPPPGTGDGTRSLRDLRNLLAHATLDDAQIKEVRRLAGRTHRIGSDSRIHPQCSNITAGPLWHPAEDEPRTLGGCFLDLPPAREVLRTFGIDDPGEDYRRFLQAVEAQLTNPGTD